jgi:6,7-dimethyl-8-ribityllumazine synthase
MTKKISTEKPAARKAHEHHGSLDATGRRFAIVVSRFNEFITERLLKSAVEALRKCGAQDDDIEIARVPGAFEVPGAARTLAGSKQFDAVICLACIIRGETTHYEHLANEVTRGVGQSAQDTGVPHAYGILTCEDLQQAIDRAGLKSGNKGWDAALSAVEMATLKKQITSDDAGDRRAQPTGETRERRSEARFSDLERLAHHHTEKHLRGKS